MVLLIQDCPLSWLGTGVSEPFNKKWQVRSVLWAQTSTFSEMLILKKLNRQNTKFLLIHKYMYAVILFKTNGLWISDSNRHRFQNICPPISQIVLNSFMKISSKEILIKLPIVLKISKCS